MITILGILYGWVLYVIPCTIWACLLSLVWYILLSVFPCIVCLGSPHWTQGMTYTQEIRRAAGGLRLRAGTQAVCSLGQG